MAGLKYDADLREFTLAIDGVGRKIAKAATSAMRRVVDEVKEQGQADIRAAGFSKRWEDALSARTYPERGNSISPAGVIVHRIPYSSVFEEGASITGRGLLWLPTREAFKYMPRGVLPTPERFIRNGYRLASVNVVGRPPMLAVVKPQSRSGGGLAGKRLRRGESIPREVVFHGVKTVTIQQKFNLTSICERAAEKLPGYYEEAIKADG